jgi:hypothetical protein
LIFDFCNLTGRRRARRANPGRLGPDWPTPDAIVTRSIHQHAAKTAQNPAAALLSTFQTNASALTPKVKRELVIVDQALNNREPLNLTNLGAPENRRVTFVNVSR